MKLQVTGLEKKYTSEELFGGMSFRYGSGIIGISGTNGSGKSTLMKCISGLAVPSAGEIEWEVGGEAFNPSTISPHLGYAAPYVQLYEELTATENLQFISDLRHRQPCESIPDLIKLFEITPFRNSLYGEISSGQQQRVKLAAAAVHKPRILCLDEPGTNLDESGNAIVRQMADACLKRGGMVLLASNQAEELKICSEVIELSGRKKGISV